MTASSPSPASATARLTRLTHIAWAPPTVFVLHALAARLFGHEPYVDSASHFLGGAAIAHFLDRLPELAPGILGRPSRMIRWLAVVGSTTVVALGWELLELGSDLFLGTHIQLSAANTLRDLALGLMGGAATALWLPAQPSPAELP